MNTSGSKQTENNARLWLVASVCSYTVAYRALETETTVR